MEAGFSFHTGIRRDPDDITTWRRVGDGQAVELSPDGWLAGFPKSDPSLVYVQWYFNAGSATHNKIINYKDEKDFFICEY